MNKPSGDVIILHLCNKNHNHMMYASWDMECGRHIFCHFGPFFALLTLYWLWKLKFGKNVKKIWRYYPFTQVYQKWRLCNVWFLRYNATDSFLSVWVIFCPLTLLTTQKIKIKKKKKRKKTPRDIITLHDGSWDFRLFFALLPPAPP